MTLLRPASSNAFLIFVTAIAAVIVSVPHATAGSQYVIISAEPASDELPLGRLFVPSDIVNVPAGTVVTLLGEDGSVNSISGPGAFMVTMEPNRTEQTGMQESLSKLALIAGLLANERERTESIGGSRGIADQPKQSGLDDPWAISFDESGPGCIRNRELILTRQEAGESVVFSIRLDDGDTLNGLVWNAGMGTYSLAEPIPPEANTLTVDTNKTSARIEIKTVPVSTDLENPLDILGWMVTSGCKRQALAFARQLVAREK